MPVSPHTNSTPLSEELVAADVASRFSNLIDCGVMDRISFRNSVIRQAEMMSAGGGVAPAVISLFQPEHTAPHLYEKDAASIARGTLTYDMRRQVQSQDIKRIRSGIAGIIEQAHRARSSNEDGRSVCLLEGLKHAHDIRKITDQYVTLPVDTHQPSGEQTAPSVQTILRKGLLEPRLREFGQIRDFLDDVRGKIDRGEISSNAAIGACLGVVDSLHPKDPARGSFTRNEDWHYSLDVAIHRYRDFKGLCHSGPLSMPIPDGAVPQMRNGLDMALGILEPLTKAMREMSRVINDTMDGCDANLLSPMVRAAIAGRPVAHLGVPLKLPETLNVARQTMAGLVSRQPPVGLAATIYPVN